MPAPLLVGDVFRNAARAVPDRVAAVIGDRALTFGQLDRASNAAVHELLGAQVRPGDRVMVLAHTDLALVVLFAAIAKLGAVFVPVNPAWSAAELSPIRDAARPELVLLDPRWEEASPTGRTFRSIARSPRRRYTSSRRSAAGWLERG